MTKAPKPNAPALFVGPFPPPVHGQSVATRDLAAELRKRGIALTVRDIGGSGARKVVQHIAAAMRILTGPEGRVYVSVNSHQGMALTVMLALAARLRGKTLLLHHHSFEHIGWDRPMARRLIAAGGPEAWHITNCGRMATLLAERYPGVRRTLPFSNVGSVDEGLKPANGLPDEDRPVVIGHMSNLTEAKGIGRVVESFAKLRERGMDVRLVIAGPASDSFAKENIVAAQQRFGDAVTVLGPVYGEAKTKFFASIDIFAFPSLYPTETQGIVNLEAMASGVPVVAFDQCCIGSDIGSDGGMAIDRKDDFTAALADFVAQFQGDRNGWRERARYRFDTLFAEFLADRDRVCQHIAGTAPDGAVQ